MTGKINKSIVRTLTENGARAVGLSGKDGGMIGWVSEDYIYEITTEPLRE